MENWQTLINLFLERNQKINLSAIRKPEDVYKKHILDSLELNKVFQFEPGKKVLDVGTGGGFPLLPLAITNQKTDFIGIDSRNKKITAVQDIIFKLGIKNVRTIRTRSEDFQGNFDYIVARAVGYCTKLLPQILHLTKIGGTIILYKQDFPEEKNDLIAFCKKNKISIFKEYSYQLFEGDITRKLFFLKIDK